MGAIERAGQGRTWPAAQTITPVQGELIERGEWAGDAQLEASTLHLLLKDKRSAETRRAYEGDLRHFHLMTGADFGARQSGAPLDAAQFLADVDGFLSWPPPRVAARLAVYKAAMIEGGLKEATINRRLAAVRALFRFAFRLGRSQTDGRGLVENEKVHAYLNTRGYNPDVIKRLLKLPAKMHGEKTVRALRDEAILRACVEMGLRRVEVHRLDVKDFSLANRHLSVLGKARGSQKQTLDVPVKLANVIAEYLMTAGHATNRDEPLFWNLDRNTVTRGRLGLKGVEKVVSSYQSELGVEILRPHELRHTSINQACVKFKGNVPYIMSHSRHADANTVMKYIRNAEGAQGKIATALEELFD